MYQVLDVRLLKIPGTVEELAPLAREYGFDGLDVPGRKNRREICL